MNFDPYDPLGPLLFSAQRWTPELRDQFIKTLDGRLTPPEYDILLARLRTAGISLTEDMDYREAATVIADKADPPTVLKHWRGVMPEATKLMLRWSDRNNDSNNEDVGAVRAWARNHGYTVKSRGRIPAAIYAAYREAIATGAPN
jgi:hypothetical protein